MTEHQLPIAREEWDDLLAGDKSAHRMRAPWHRRSSDYPGWDYDGEGDGVPSLRVLAICIGASWLAVVLLIAGLWKLLR